MSINKDIRDMMRRDPYFKERMMELGYKPETVVAVLDLERQIMFTPDDQFPFRTLANDYLDLYLSVPNARTFKRIPLTGKVLHLAEELSEEAPDIRYPKPEETEDVEPRRHVFHDMFMYEMLLLLELEKQLELSKDSTLHVVGEKGLTQGVSHMAAEISQQFAPVPDNNPFVLKPKGF